MSKDYELKWPGHPNIYQHTNQRDINIYFSEPENGVNSETGILLLIPGFGASSQSNVYKKMRSIFADQYNLITIQCDYFGQEFMQGSKSVNLDIAKEQLEKVFSLDEIQRVYSDGFDANGFIQVGKKYPLNISAKESLNESIENFNDMGLMQAIDNITALYYVMRIIEDNQLSLNMKKIILFGQSQGAYLSYLCNALAPNLFSLLIDNSAWLFPEYLHSSRYLTMEFGKMKIHTEFDYLASKIDYDESFLNLSSLYELFENNCEIVCYQGVTDNLIRHDEKREFCDKVKHCTYHEIGATDVDGEIFKSTNHGLDADFLNFFAYVMDKASFKHREVVEVNSVNIVTDKKVYEVNYETELPVLTVSERHKEI